MANALKKIRARAKQIRKAHPATKWLTAIKQASRDYNSGNLKPKRTRRAAPKKRRARAKKRVSNISSINTNQISMATRRTRRTHKRTHARRRHRRVGAMSLTGSNSLLLYGSLAAGFLVGDKLNDTIQSKLVHKTGDNVGQPIIPGKALAAGEVGLGYLLIQSKKKSKMKTIAGGFLAGAGLKRLLKEFNVISGYGKVPVVGAARRALMNGYGKVPVVGGYNGGYTPSTMLAGGLNGALNGYAVPQPGRNLVGSFDNGSGINSDSR